MPDGVIRRGRIYRAEALVMPGGSNSYSIYDDTHRLEYEAIRVNTVIDLRAASEQQRAPSAWPAALGAHLIKKPIAEGGEGADTNYMKMLLAGEMDRFGITEMIEFYIALATRRASIFGEILRFLSSESNLPTLIHCAAGKDRTGILIALLLSVLGVSKQDIVDDYVLTEILRPNRIDAFASRFIAVDRDPEIARTLFEAPAEAMEGFLGYLDDTYGGVAEYLIQCAGVDAEVLARLRRNMITPAA